MDTQAHVSISIIEGRIEISGSESFVKEQMDNLKDLIHKSIGNQLKYKPGSPPIPPPPPLPPSGYEKVIACDGDKIQILKDIPGKNNAKKTVNVALIYLHAKGLKGEEMASFKEVQKACEAHACLDQANFAATLKKQKKLFLVDGTGKSQTLKLTHPGKEQAAALVADLNAE